MNTKVFTAALAATTIFSVVPAQAQQGVRFSFDGRPERLFRPIAGLNMTDTRSVKDAAITNMLEIKAGELAANRARSEWARQFALDMVREHKAAQAELRIIAMRKGVALPSALPREKKMMLSRLARLNGSTFDRAYRNMMLSGHNATAIKLMANIRNGRDEDVKAYLVKTLPAVQYHHRLAKTGHTITGSLKPTGNA